MNKLKCIYMKLSIYNAKQYEISAGNTSITISEEERLENQNNLDELKIMTITPSMMLHVANLLKEEVKKNNNNIESSTNSNVDRLIQDNLQESIDDLEELAYYLNRTAVASSSSSSKPPKIHLNSGAIAGIIIGSIVGLSLLVFIIYKIKSKKIYKFQPSNLNKNNITKIKKQKQL